MLSSKNLAIFSLLLFIFLAVPSFQIGNNDKGKQKQSPRNSVQIQRNAADFGNSSLNIEQNEGGECKDFAMLLKAAQFLNDAQLPDEEAQNRNNPANETDKVPESPGRKRKMATIKRVPTKKRDCKGQASSSQSIQTKEAENIPPNESANQLADQGTVSADAVSPIESIDPLNNDQEDEMHFLQLGNFNLDYELASPVQPTMPPYFSQDKELADLPIPTQQLANKFRQNALLSEPDRTGGSGSSLSPKIQVVHQIQGYFDERPATFSPSLFCFNFYKKPTKSNTLIFLKAYNERS